MARLILGLLLISAILLAVVAVAKLFTPAAPIPVRPKEDAVPAVFRNVAYALLIMLMVGIATGWLGGL